KLRPLRPEHVLKEALKLLRSTISRSVEIVEDIRPEEQAILSDATQLHQLLMNLCTNAYHAIGEQGGRIWVTLRPVRLEEDRHIGGRPMAAGAYLRLSVEDTGPG